MSFRIVESKGERRVAKRMPDGRMELVESVSAASRKSAQDSDDTMEGGKYPIRNQSEANEAWNLRNNGTASASAVVAHIRKQCKKHGLTFPGGD